MTILTIVTASVLGAAIWAVLCRINKMQHRRTSALVFAQHAVLGASLFLAVLVPPQWALLTLGAGVFVFLLLGSGRWRDGAPDGIKTAPAPLDSAQLRHAHGGKR
jgi:hypothetical protein